MTISSEPTLANKQKLISDVKTVISDAEEILRATANQAGEKAVELRERVQERLREARFRLSELEASVVDKTKAACRATDDFVHEQPWTAVGIAAAVGLCFGLLIGRR